MLNIKILRSFFMVEKRRTLYIALFGPLGQFLRRSSKETMICSYEFSGFSDFVTVFNGLYLDDQKELNKNKIYRDYLLFEKMRFPAFLFIWLQILVELRWVKVGGISGKSACTAPLMALKKIINGPK